MSRILAIETSCDETAIAIVEFSGSQRNPKIKILSNIISSQVKLHAKYGGVVPNLAKREHQRNLVPVLLQALKEADLIKPQTQSENKTTINKLRAILDREPELFKRFLKKIISLETPEVDVIAVTHGPGLAPALWAGVNFAKALSYLWNKPLVPVNHMAGHLYSPLLDAKSHELKSVKFPALALLVSGGHTELVLMSGHGKFKVIGETLDDAAGEAFDKVARILGLKYPGGPEISRLADQAKFDFNAAEDGLHPVKLPRPVINSQNYNFSFSGLKTAVLYLTRDLGEEKTKKLRFAVAKEFQDAVVDVLISKTIRAAREYKIKTILLGGGVAANKLLRKRMAEEIEKKLPAINYWLPALFMTGDNAPMIALAAYFMRKKKAPKQIGADANLKF